MQHGAQAGLQADAIGWGDAAWSLVLAWDGVWTARYSPSAAQGVRRLDRLQDHTKAN